MRNWAVLVLIVLAAAAGGAAWALAIGGGDHQSNTPSLAERIASLGDHSSAESGLIMDRCFNLLPLTDESGQLNPDLVAFPARLLDKQFELTAVRFGDLCYDTPPTKMLETEWRHRETGVELLLDQSANSEASTRIAPLYASFHDAGYDFYLLNVNTVMQPEKAPGGSTVRRVIEVAVQQLQPPIPLSCFYRSISKDWTDLAALGIGDPRSSLPNGYRDVRLDFTSLERPAPNCPTTSGLSSAEPEVQFQAMFSGPGTSLLAIFARSLTPEDGAGQATFGPGGARWQNAEFSFSMNWAPEHVSEEEARAIARALDPGFGAICSLSARSVDFSAIQQNGVREPVRPGGAAAIVNGTFLLIADSPGCSSASREGFQAHWIMEYRDRAGLVDVTALNGEQLPNTRPFVFEDKTLYWRRADGVEFYVSGLKAEFSKDELLAVARSVDPTFDESRLSAPPPP